jgi:hypothetical protein
MSAKSHLGKALLARAKSHWTGEIRLAQLLTDSPIGSVFLYLGEPYAVALEGYVPPLVARLRSAGIVDETCTAMLAHAFPDGQQDQRVGQFGVDQGWLSVERLGEFHAEFMLASLGALLALRNVGISSVNGAITDRFCALPVASEVLFTTIDLRNKRTRQAWDCLPGVSCNSIMKYVRVSPLTHPISELLAAARTMDGSRSIDEVAYFCGFTRAEVVFLAAVLQDEVAIQNIGEAQPSGTLLVPEGCCEND